MWVKLTPTEMIAASQKRYRSRIKGSLFIGVSICGLSLLSSSSLFAKTREEHPHPPHFDGGGPLFPQIGQLPSTVLFGFIGAFAFYFFASRPGKPTMICMKCGTAKYADGSLQCKCGGHFEDMNNLK